MRPTSRTKHEPLAPGSIVATLPLRSLHDGKRRLAGHLTQRQRTMLITFLFEGVVAALRDSNTVATISIVSGDGAALAFGRSLGLVPLREAAAGLNEALLGANAWARAVGAAANLIVLPDLPLLQADDIQTIAGGLPPRGIVACPDRSRTGTNILLAQPVQAIAPMFGPRSFERHMIASQTAGLDFRVYDSPGTRWDIDTPADLDGLKLDW